MKADGKESKMIFTCPFIKINQFVFNNFKYNRFQIIVKDSLHASWKTNHVSSTAKAL
jgi:hypothetical protein